MNVISIHLAIGLCSNIVRAQSQGSLYTCNIRNCIENLSTIIEEYILFIVPHLCFSLHLSASLILAWYQSVQSLRSLKMCTTFSSTPCFLIWSHPASSKSPHLALMRRRCSVASPSDTCVVFSELSKAHKFSCFLLQLHHFLSMKVAASTALFGERYLCPNLVILLGLYLTSLYSEIFLSRGRKSSPARCTFSSSFLRPLSRRHEASRVSPCAALVLLLSTKFPRTMAKVTLLSTTQHP